jgi:HK97 gp10 family phage protein
MAAISFFKWKNELQIAAYKTVVEQLNIEAAALVIQMKAAAPVGRENGGDLRDSIRTEPGKTPTTIRIAAGGKATTVGSYDYARAIEFGTQKMPPQPFFFNTYNAHKRKLKQNMKDKLGGELRKFSI